MSSTIVVDTNIFMSNLALIDELLGFYPYYHHIIVVPSQVTRELDGLKNSNATAVAARRANNWLFGVLSQSNPGIRGQRLEEKVDAQATKDDGILDCCLYFERAGHSVVLLSNDKNLCIKSLTQGIPTVTYRPGLEAKAIAEKIAEHAGIAVQTPDVEMAEEPGEPGEPAEAAEAVEQVGALAPAPRHLRYSRYKLIRTLEADIFDTLMENTCVLCEHLMHQWWTEKEYMEYNPEVRPSPAHLGAVITRFHGFSGVLPDEILEAFRAIEYPERPKKRDEWPYFIEFWGAVCMWLSGNDPRYRRMAEIAETRFSEFFAPLARDRD